MKLFPADPGLATNVISVNWASPFIKGTSVLPMTLAFVVFNEVIVTTDWESVKILFPYASTNSKSMDLAIFYPETYFTDESKLMPLILIGYPAI